MSNNSFLETNAHRVSKNELFQNIGTSLALVISVAALIVSIYETNLLKEQQRSMVWPYLTVSPSYNAQGFLIEVSNDGIGPAIIKSVQIQYGGKNYKNWETLREAILPGSPIGYDIVRQSELNGTVIKAGEEKEILGIPWMRNTDREKQIRKITQGLAKISTKVCYCSVQNDCWLFDNGKIMPVEKAIIFDDPFEE